MKTAVTWIHYSYRQLCYSIICNRRARPAYDDLEGARMEERGAQV